MPVSSAATDASTGAPLAIGVEGGIFRGAGAQIIVPPGALTKDTSFKISRVEGDAVAD